MRIPPRLSLVLYIAALSLVLVTVLAEQVDQSQVADSQAASADQPIEEEGQQQPRDALYDARTVLKDLAPPPYAHLERKVGVIGSLGSQGWGDGLGWSQDGPLSTALRLLPRLLNTLLTPLSFLKRLPSSSYISQNPVKAPNKRVKISKARKGKIDLLFDLVAEAEQAGCGDVHGFKANLKMFPPRGIKQDLPGAFAEYEKYLTVKPDPEAQFMVGFFHATGLGGIEEDQGKALLYYTFSALQGFRPAEMTMGYRTWAGIGLKEDCMTALDYYEGAAEKAYARFLSGPPGGRTLPLTISRLSDLVGGIYGPHASWASTGANSLRPAVRAASASARGETEAEVLEYYQYHSDRDAHVFTVRLGRLFYLGSVYPITLGLDRGPGISAGAEGVGEIPQSFTKAREYFMRVARTMWPKDLDAKGNVMPKRRMSKEAEDSVRDPAMVAAAFLGRMALRGEGQKVDYKRAKMWYQRAADLGDREAFNGLGIMHRDGLGVPRDLNKAFHLFTGAAGQDLVEAQVNLGKMHMERGELQQAFQYYEVAIQHGSPFEAFYLLGKIHSTRARLPLHAGGQTGSCGVGVAYYKMVNERGTWFDDHVAEGDRAWARGEEEVSMVKWLIAAEMGSEIGQNNVAFLLDQGKGGELYEGKVDGDMAMRYWIRSAAQNNVDAMVKVGDLYYSGQVNATPKAEGTPLEVAANYYQTAADSQQSAMAYWNLGWMYEMGMGVPRDWHLAKRYYTMSGETTMEAWPAVVLSMTGLYLRSWWTEIKSGGEIPGLRLFEPSTEEEIKAPSFWDRIGNLFTLPPMDYDEVEYDDLSGATWGGGGQPGVRGENGEMEDWEEDIADTVLILGVVLGIMGLVWFRQLWARLEAARMQRAAAGQQGDAQLGRVGQGGQVQPGQGEQAGNEEEEAERRRREDALFLDPPVL